MPRGRPKKVQQPVHYTEVSRNIPRSRVPVPVGNPRYLELLKKWQQVTQGIVDPNVIYQPGVFRQVVTVPTAAIVPHEQTIRAVATTPTIATESAKMAAAKEKLARSAQLPGSATVIQQTRNVLGRDTIKPHLRMVPVTEGISTTAPKVTTGWTDAAKQAFKKGAAIGTFIKPGLGSLAGGLLAAGAIVGIPHLTQALFGRPTRSATITPEERQAAIRRRFGTTYVPEGFIGAAGTAPITATVPLAQTAPVSLQTAPSALTAPLAASVPAQVTPAERVLQQAQDRWRRARVLGDQGAMQDAAAAGQQARQTGTVSPQGLQTAWQQQRLQEQRVAQGIMETPSQSLQRAQMMFRTAQANNDQTGMQQAQQMAAAARAAGATAEGAEQAWQVQRGLEQQLGGGVMPTAHHALKQAQAAFGQAQRAGDRKAMEHARAQGAAARALGATTEQAARLWQQTRR